MLLQEYQEDIDYLKWRRLNDYLEHMWEKSESYIMREARSQLEKKRIKEAYNRYIWEHRWRGYR